MYSKTNRPPRRSAIFDQAAIDAMDRVLYALSRLGTFDHRQRDREIALYVESAFVPRKYPVTDWDRDWDDGWLHGIALAAGLARRQQANTGHLRAYDAVRNRDAR